MASLLAARGTPFVALDTSMQAVGGARAQGLPVYFGDASRPEVLDAAGIGRARAVVITIDEPHAAEHVIAALRQRHAGLAIIARGRDASHRDRLSRAGASAIIQEAIEPGLQMGATALRTLGASADEVDQALDRFRRESADLVENKTGAADQAPAS